VADREFPFTPEGWQQSSKTQLQWRRRGGIDRRCDPIRGRIRRALVSGGVASLNRRL